MRYARSAAEQLARFVFTHVTRVRLVGSLALSILVLGAATLIFAAPPAPDAHLALQAPSFVTAAYASDVAQTPTFPADIGISAYFNAPNGITINNRLRGIYRTIEDQTDDYIVGSVPIEGYGTSEDVHVYIHKDGWVLAYYRSAEPASKIVDWVGYQAGSNAVPNKLTKALATAAGGAGVGVPAQPSYYHFQYPEANRMTIAVHSANNANRTREFTMRLPSDGFDYYETSYALGCDDGGSLAINSQEVASCSGAEQRVAQTSPILRTEQEHAISVRTGFSSEPVVGAILVIYKEQ
ncbi:MAG: hypothetical protein HC911_14910 [Chloroflexaceae bacterium]|nr:hypothetical protein [Chloroflexaceae bacterium]